MAITDIKKISSHKKFDHKKTRSWRQVWLDVHLYLGLFVGALLVVFGVTGSILVFFQEIDEWLNPELLTVTVPAQIESADGKVIHQPLHKIFHAAEQAAAPSSKITTLYAPRNSEGVFAVYADQESGNWQRIFVDPYRAQVTGVRSYGADEWVPDYLMDFIFQLHFSLLLGANGITLVAIAALLLIVSLITGLIVWWPVTGQWLKALTIKPNAGAVRFNVDLHKTLSLYFFPVLGAVLLAGVYMNLNDPFVWVTQQFSPPTRESPQKLLSAPVMGVQPIGGEQAWASVMEYFPEGELSAIYFPGSEVGVYMVVQRNVPGLSIFWSERQLAIDQYSGEILSVRAPDTRRSAGEIFLDWQWPLHSGKAFGWIGRILVFLCGLACPVIYVTGVVRWLQKRRAQQTKGRRHLPGAVVNREIGGAI